MIFCLFISRTTFSGGDGWVFFQLSRLQKLYKSRIFPNSSFQNEDACWFPSTDGWSLLLKYNDVMFWTVDQTENGFFLISYWDFLQSFLKSPKNNTKQLYLNGSKMNHLSQSQWRSFLTFCQMSSNCSTPSATFFRHRSISPGGEERSRTTERIREKRERH